MPEVIAGVRNNVEIKSIRAGFVICHGGRGGSRVLFAIINRGSLYKYPISGARRVGIYHSTARGANIEGTHV